MKELYKALSSILVRHQRFAIMEALPEELLARVFSYLCICNVFWSVHREAQRRLAALSASSQVNRTFNRIAEPLLYESLDLRITRSRTFQILGQPGVECVTGIETPISVVTLLCALFARPHRQQYVRNLHIEEPDGSKRGWWKTFPPGLLENMRNTIDNMELPYGLEEDLVNAIKGDTRRSEHGMTVMVVCLCSNLRSLQINGSRSVFTCTTLWEFLKYCGKPASASTTMTAPLQRLEHLQLDYVNAHLGSCGPLLQRPQLRSFNISQDELQDFLFTECDTKFTSALTTLSVRGLSQCPGNELKRIFASFPSLECLTIGRGCCD